MIDMILSLPSSVDTPGTAGTPHTPPLTPHTHEEFWFQFSMGFQTGLRVIDFNIQERNNISKIITFFFNLITFLQTHTCTHWQILPMGVAHDYWL